MTTPRSPSDYDPTPLPEQAAHWWVVLNDESSTAADRNAFTAWVQRSPERVEAFLRVSMLTSALQTGAVRWPEDSAEELIERARNASAEIISLPLPSGEAAPASIRPRRPSQRRSLHMLLTAAAATFCIAVVAVWLAISPSSYETGLGEQRSVVMNDGSIVTLNTGSRIEVEYSKRTRFIRLVRGEALFEVARDTARPFDVSVGTAIVRAVGTQFNIDRRTDRATVTVVEGSVQMIKKPERPRGSAAGSSDPSLEAVSEVLVAAQRVVVTESGMSPPERIADLAPVTAWKQGRLVFESRSLSEVAAEFNRYNRHRILIESDELRAQQVTGVFLAQDASSFLAFISGIPGVSVRRTENGDHVVYMNSLGTGGGPN